VWCECGRQEDTCWVQEGNGLLSYFLRDFLNNVVGYIAFSFFRLTIFLALVLVCFLCKSDSLYTGLVYLIIVHLIG